MTGPGKVINLRPRSRDDLVADVLTAARELGGKADEHERRGYTRISLGATWRLRVALAVLDEHDQDGGA